MEIKTIEDYLNEISQEYTENKLTFEQVVLEYRKGNCSFDFIQCIIKPAMHRLAKQTAISQREACAEAAEVKYIHYPLSVDCVVDEESILNTKLVVD